MKIIYIDNVSFFSLISIVLSGAKYSHLFYFNKSSRSDAVINFFLKSGLLQVRPQPADFSLADIKDEKGVCQFVRIVEDIKDICLQVSDKTFARSHFLKGFSNYFEFRKILLFFEKTISPLINDSVIFLHAARWHAVQNHKTTGDAVLFFVERTLWSKYLAQYSIDKLGIRTVEYRSLVIAHDREYFAKGKSFLASLIRTTRQFGKPNKIAKSIPVNKPKDTSTKKPLIASWYTGKSITFDIQKRSDFFWLLGSDIPRAQVLIYFDRVDIPATGEIADILEKGGVNFLALTNKARTSGNIPLWHPGSGYLRKLLYFLLIIFYRTLSNLICLRAVPFFLSSNMIVFVLHYSYWHDFFKLNGFKISIDPNEYTRMSVCKQLAIEHNQGVSISYQWSHLSFASSIFGSGTDVMFSFGPAYRWIWESTHSAIKSLVYSGYMTDCAFKEVTEDSRKLRAELLRKGVKFVICYFDENSSDDRMIPIPNKRSAEIYKYFIEQMLKDETLGLIFKPVFPKTLYQRISSISDLLEKARASGRCIFMDKGSYVSEQYPTEAAQAADLCIGLLLSGTVVLESYLSGTRAVFLDKEGLYTNPLYQTGKNQIVFDDLGELFTAINAYRMDAQNIPGFGDLSFWIKDKDPFKDGNASSRIGSYINWLLEMFAQGKTREEAMTYANRRFTELWGKENIVGTD